MMGKNYKSVGREESKQNKMFHYADRNMNRIQSSVNFSQMEPNCNTNLEWAWILQKFESGSTPNTGLLAPLSYNNLFCMQGLFFFFFFSNLGSTQKLWEVLKFIAFGSCWQSEWEVSADKLFNKML